MKTHIEKRREEFNAKNENERIGIVTTERIDLLKQQIKAYRMSFIEENDEAEQCEIIERIYERNKELAMLQRIVVTANNGIYIPNK